MFERYVKKCRIRQNIKVLLQMRCQYCSSNPASRDYLPNENVVKTVKSVKTKDGVWVEKSDTSEVLTPATTALKCDRHCLALLLQAKAAQLDLDTERR